MKHRMIILFLYIFTTLSVVAQYSGTQIALMKYSGGGDWYANPTSLPNLVSYCNEKLNTQISEDIEIVEPGSRELFNYPFIHATGHGNILFSNREADNLRTYLLAGGFLHIDDNYGIDEYFRREIKKIFPDKKLVQLPANHPLFSAYYSFSKGLPKIHEHDNKAPVAFGVFHEKRLICLYTYESDLGDGWEDAEVHNDSWETREKALKMGANIIYYVFTGQKKLIK